jgi:hypothetical protein
VALMAIKTIKQGAGLWDEASTVDVPEGALRTAQNVLLHRPGLIVPRWGWKSLMSNAGAYRPVMLAPVRDGLEVTDIIASTYNGSAYKYEVVVEGSTYTTGAIPPAIADSIEMKVAQARGSIYSTSTLGIMKLDAIGDDLERAGAYTDYAALIAYQAPRPLSTDTRYAIGPERSVGYRYCWVHKDANGYDRRSPVSEVATVENVSATIPSIVTFERMFLPLGIVAGDQIEVYRTLGADNGGTVNVTEVGAEYFLTITYTVTSADVTATYIEVHTLIDSTPDDQLGATLYTAPSQGGALLSKDPPPLCRDIARWQDVMWGAHITERASLTIEFLHAKQPTSATAGTDRSRDHVGWGFGIHDCAFTIGSAIATWTVAAPYTDAVVIGMKTGQHVHDSSIPTSAGTRVPANTTISGLRTKITIDNTRLNSAANPDSIKLGDVTFTWDGGGGSTSVTVGGTSTISATNLAAKINAYPWTGTLAAVGDSNADWSLSATSSGAVVTITDAQGFGVYGADITLANPANADGMIPSYEMTMSANALASGTSSTRYTDWLTINSIKFYANGESIISYLNDAGLYDDPTGLNQRSGIGSTRTNVQTCEDNAYLAAEGINYYQISPIASDRGFGVSAISSGATLLLLGATPDASAITVQCTVKPAAFRPNLATAITSANRIHPGRIAFSSPGEPEAFPPLQYFDVGDPTQAIERIIPLRDALLVWKRDGLYRVTGAPPDQWRVDPIDTTVWLVHPECVTVLENVCYAWTNRGVIAVNEGGIGDVVSLPIANELRRVASLLPRSGDGASVNRGFSMTVHETLRLILLSLSDSTIEGSTTSSVTYIYSLATGAWSSSNRANRWLAWDPNRRRLLESSGLGEWRVFTEYADDGTGSLAWFSDWQQATLPTAQTNGLAGCDVSDSDVTPRSFEIGDILDYGSGTPRYARVTDVSFVGSDWTLTTDRIAPSTGTVNVTWYKAIDSQVQWHAQTAGSAAMGTHWQEAVLQLDSSDGSPTTWPLEIGGASHLQAIGSPETVTATITSASEPIAKPVRVGLPRNVSRSPLLWPYMRIRTALVRWAASALSLVARSTGTRVTR